jgi:limonene-1,2-epoxide hydrolase
VDPVVDHLLEALRRRDWATVRPVLHPYLHWECEDGTSLRGRKRVLAMLASAPVPEPPSSVELRDGQIYRWLR